MCEQASKAFAEVAEVVLYLYLGGDLMLTKGSTGKEKWVGI